MVYITIANFFTILLQYNSKHRIALFTVLQNNNNILLVFSPETSLSSKLFAQALLSLFLLCFSLCSLSTQSSEISPISEISHSLKLHRHLQNFSSISEISHPSPSPKFLTRFTLTHLNRFTLSHLHHWSFTLTHSPIHPHLTLTDSPLPHPFTLSRSPIHPHPFTLTLTHSQGFLGLG